MEITCPNCGITRNVDDKLIPRDKPRVTTLCRSCGHRFTLHLDQLGFLGTSAAPEDTQDMDEGRKERRKKEAAAAANNASAAPKQEESTAPLADTTGETTAEAAPEAGAPEPTPHLPPPDKQTAAAAKKHMTQRPKPKQKARSIGVILSKGGVGKTTTSVNLAAGLATAGYKVLLVDTDTQGQSSYMLGVKPEYGLAELVAKEVSPQKALHKARERLWLLAGGRSLAGLKRLIDRKDFGGELTLAEALEPFETHFDFIIVDSSPGWDPITVNVLFFVKEILIPVSLEVMSLQGLSEFSKSLATIQKYRNDLGITYIVPTFLDYKISSRVDIYEKLKELYADYLCTPVRYDPSLSEAPAYGQTIYEYDDDSSGVVDYKALVRKVTDGDALL